MFAFADIGHEGFEAVLIAGCEEANNALGPADVIPAVDDMDEQVSGEEWFDVGPASDSGQVCLIAGADESAIDGVFAAALGLDDGPVAHGTTTHAMIVINSASATIVVTAQTVTQRASGMVVIAGFRRCAVPRRVRADGAAAVRWPRSASDGFP